MEEFPLLSSTNSVDTHITLWQQPLLEWETVPLFRSRQEWDDEHGVPYQAVYKSQNHAYHKLVYRDLLSFIFKNDGSELYMDATSEIKGEGMFRAFLYGAGLGYALHLKGTPILHGSVVNVNGQAMGFVGQSTAGKSTTATAISQLGHHLMTDDIIPLYSDDQQEEWVVAPGYRRMRLWEDASIALNRTALEAVLTNSRKHYVEIENFRTDVRPIKTIFILSGRRLDIKTPVIEHLSKQESLMSLLPNTYFYNFYEPDKKKIAFKAIGSLVNQVNVYNVIMPHDLGLLQQSCEILVELHQETT